MTQRFVRAERRYLASELDEKVEERRYLVAATTALVGEMDKRAAPETYLIRTDYIEGPEDKARHRLRFYNGEKAGWHEKKHRRGVVVYKSREPAETMPAGFHRVIGVTYTRRAWQVGKTRLTLDAGVRSDDKALPLQVLEVKGPIPRWLKKLLPQRADFSKRRWAENEKRALKAAELDASAFFAPITFGAVVLTTTPTFGKDTGTTQELVS